MQDVRTENEVFAEWKVAQGEQKESLLQELVKLLQRHAIAICWNKLSERRPDIVNLAVWKAISASEGFRGEAKFSTWFHGIVLNLCNSALRTKQRDRTVSLDAGEVDYAAPAVDSNAGIALEQALDGLSESDREFIEMKKNGWTETEIAEALGINLVTVRQRWMRIKARVKRNAGE